MKGSGLGAKGLALAAGLAVSSLVVSCLAVSGFSRTSQPQQPAPQPPPPTFRTEANYVRVDVFPTTKDDAPVTDLTQADFEVLEGGAPQKIEQFERVVIRGGVPQDLRRRAEHASRESRASGAEPARARVRAVSRHRPRRASTARTASGSRWSTRSIA